MEINQQQLKIVCNPGRDYTGFLEELIRKSSEKEQQKVVVGDEYDKPILDNGMTRKKLKLSGFVF